MTIHTERLELPLGLDREKIRRFVIERFLEELPGTGTEELASKYIYIVEECESRPLKIARQANLNKGMDFKIQFDDVFFQGKKRRTRAPSHTHIFNELIQKRQNYANSYVNLVEAIKSIYLCQDIDNMQLRAIQMSEGLLTAEELVLTIKWMFIEQDITYWGYSGRGMLYHGLCEQGLVW